MLNTERKFYDYSHIRELFYTFAALSFKFRRYSLWQQEMKTLHLFWQFIQE